MLDNQSAIIEYFLSDSALYIFVLTNKNLDEETIKLDITGYRTCQTIQAIITKS